MMRRQSLSGRPAFTPRTMMSTAPGNSLRNFFMRRLRSQFTSQNGKPSAPAAAKAAVA
ncbi:hypothetical protein D3C83_229500 [compost metagenome]